MCLYYFMIFLLMVSCESEGVAYRGFNDVSLMPLARSDMSATLFHGAAFNDEARIYLVGGCAANQVCPPGGFCYCPVITNRTDYYLPESDKYIRVADAPRARNRHVAVNLKGKLYVLGGRDGADALVKEVDVYDPKTNTWDANPFIWQAATSDLGAFVEGDRIFLAGGYDSVYTPLDSLQELQTVGGAKPFTVSNLSPMLQGGRGDVGAVSVPKDASDPSKGSHHYIVGGFAVSICDPLASVEEYDVSSGQWSMLAPMLLPRADLAIGVIANEMFAVAGETKDATCNATTYAPGVSIPVADVERFDAAGSMGVVNASGEWNVEEAVPGKRFRFVAASYKDAIYLFGGQGTFDPVNQTYPVLQTTMLYVPKSVADRLALSAGEIAGIVVGVWVGIAGIAVAVLSGLSYWKYRGYARAGGADDDSADSPGTEMADRKEDNDVI
jgi:hypothetical protein